MARRTPKPFAVEIRRVSRTMKPSAAASPSMADLIRETEQPRVTAWPGIDQAPQPHTGQRLRTAWHAEVAVSMLLPAGRPNHAMTKVRSLYVHLAACMLNGF